MSECVKISSEYFEAIVRALGVTLKIAHKVAL